MIGRRQFWVFLFIFLNVVMSLPIAEARDLRLVSFNALYYGLGGKMENSPGAEYRNQYLQAFFANQVPKADIYIFQEVVDFVHLPGVMVPADFRCLTYDHASDKHQHVVVCASPELKFMREPTDTNDIIDDVAIEPTRSRPALHTILADASGKPLLRIVGVHLKAYADQSATRRKQAGIIADYLTRVANPNLPTVIAGDFNTFEGDESEIGKSLEKSRLRQVSNPSEFTYRTVKYSSRFDHFWVSEGLNLPEPMWTYPVCNVGKNSRDLKTLREYNYRISDHCPVSIRVTL